jgi:hypothetical protein
LHVTTTIIIIIECATTQSPTRIKIRRTRDGDNDGAPLALLPAGRCAARAATASAAVVARLIPAHSASRPFLALLHPRNLHLFHSHILSATLVQTLALALGQTPLILSKMKAARHS